MVIMLQSGTIRSSCASLLQERKLRSRRRFIMSVRSLLVVAGLLACSGFGAWAPAQDLQAELTAGRRLTLEAAVALERQLVEDPGNLAARVQLIGHYYSERSRGEAGASFRYHQRLERAMYDRWRDHVLWMTWAAPRAEVLAHWECRIYEFWDEGAYRSARAAWLHHLETVPKDLAVLKNAAEFFKINDRTVAIEVFERIQSMDRENPLWARELGDLHRSDMLRLAMGGVLKGPDPAAAARALDQYERAYELSGRATEDSLLTYLAWTALGAGQTEKARAYAEFMLRDRTDDRTLGDRIHHGHLVLGMIALAGGKVEQAKDHLLDAGRSRGSPRLHGRGPNMVLAKDLLERGETEAFVSYLELCSKFWISTKGTLLLPRWIEMARAGEIPIFGLNLLY